MSERTTHSGESASWRSPSFSERSVFQMLLNAEFRGRREVGEQLRDAKVFELDQDGSLTLRTSGPMAEVAARIPVELTYLDADDQKAHVLLHVIDGFVNELEFFREDSGHVQSIPSEANLMAVEVNSA